MSNDSESIAARIIAGTAKWAQSLGRRERRLAPWDEFAFFDLPYEIGFTVSPSGIFQIIQADPRRVWIEFSVASGVDMVLSCNGFATGSLGTVLKAGQQPLRYIQQWDGLLPQVAWFAQSPGGSNTITIRFVTLREWPK